MTGYDERMRLRALALLDKPDVTIMAIESSCDETAVAILRGGHELLANCVYSQLNLHRRFGGVVPEEASRLHVKHVNPLIDAALLKAGLALHEIDAVAVTLGPGLVGALLVGVSAAKALAYALQVPLIGVHHIKGHLCANRLLYPELAPPFAGLVVSGGHTHLYEVREDGEFVLLGRTRDDAAGEAFDKVARVLGLGYPGGPAIEQAAYGGDAAAFAFPRARLPDTPNDFSFSGLKTAVINTVHKLEKAGDALPVHDLAASFQQAVVDVLAEKSVRVARPYRILAVAGGVAANTALRGRLQAECESFGVRLFIPSIAYCTDNAAMIARAGYEALMQQRIAGLDANAWPMWQITSHA